MGKNLVCAPPTLGSSSLDPGHGLRSGTLSPRHRRRRHIFHCPTNVASVMPSTWFMSMRMWIIQWNSSLVVGPLRASSSRWASLTLWFKPLCWYVYSWTVWCVTIPRLPRVLRRQPLNPASMPWQPTRNHRCHEGRRRCGCAPVILIPYELNYACSG
jgi:hypothetical protein